MSTIEMSVDTDKNSMAELREVLDDALQKEFPGGMLKRSWDGDVLLLSGPGAQGRITYEDGKLVGRADLKPPATLMRPVIEQKIGSVLKKLAI